MFTKVLVAIVSIVLIGCSSNQQVPMQLDELSTWVGEYSWEEYYEPAVEGNMPLWEWYSISIYEEDGNYLANLVASGHQLNLGAITEIRGNAESIDLVFIEYPDDEYIYRLFEVGDTLLTLKTNGNTIETIWGQVIAPRFGSDINARGVYFTKSGLSD